MVGASLTPAIVSGIRSRDCTESALKSLRNKWESKNEQ